MSRRAPAIELIVTGDESVAAELEGLAERARNARPAMQAILAELLGVEKAQYESEGARSGEPWPEDKPYTIARKKREGRDTRTERRTGALEKSLTAPRARGATRRASKQAMTFGTKVWYAKFQQNRPLLEVLNRDIDRMEDTIARWLMEGSTE